MRVLLAYGLGLLGMVGWDYHIHLYYLFIMTSWICITEYKVESKEIKNKIYKGFLLGQSSVFIYLMLEGYKTSEILAQFMVFFLFGILVYVQFKGKEENNYNKEKKSKMISMLMPLIMPLSFFYVWMVMIPKEYNNYFMILYIISLVKISNYIETRIGQLYFYLTQVAVSLFLFQYIELQWFVFLSFLLFLAIFQLKKMSEKTIK